MDTHPDAADAPGTPDAADAGDAADSPGTPDGRQVTNETTQANQTTTRRTPAAPDASQRDRQGSALTWVPRLAFVVASLLALTWVVNIALAVWFATANVDAYESYFAVQGIVAGTLWWTLVAASAALVVLLVTLWAPGGPTARRGLRLIAIALALRWAWWLSYRGINALFLTADPAIYASRATLMALAGLVIELGAITLLVVGGLRVREVARS